MIGKIGPYTVFVTPPSTPKPPAETVPDTPIKKNVIVSPPVQPPPPQFGKSSADDRSSSLFGLFSNAVSKVQTVHSDLDERLARWLGLNQSKYQWALDDYYENNGVVSFLPTFKFFMVALLCEISLLPHLFWFIRVWECWALSAYFLVTRSLAAQYLMRVIISGVVSIGHFNWTL